ncbi:MAG: hypothetical protein WC593_13590 [Methanoregula sp.]
MGSEDRSDFYHLILSKTGVIPALQKAFLNALERGDNDPSRWKTRKHWNKIA